MSEYNEEALVMQAIAELPYVTHAYEQLIRKHHSLIYRSALSMLRDEGDAEDATQTILLKVFHGLPNFQQRSSFKTWILTITSNTCISMLNKIKKEQAQFESTAEPDSFVGNGSEMANVQSFKEIVDDLDSTERQILTLRFVADASLQEISDIMDMGLSAVKMRYYRALEKLKDEQS